jgi:hypothetical protein
MKHCINKLIKEKRPKAKSKKDGEIDMAMGMSMAGLTALF